MHKGYLRRSIHAKSSAGFSENHGYSKVFQPKQKDLDRVKADENYIQGVEDGVNMIKAIFECSVSRRKEIFGETNVASILDRFDFIQIRNLITKGD